MLWCPEPAEVVAMAQQPIEGDQGVAAFDCALVEEGFDFGEGLDDNADVFVLFHQAVHARGGGRIDPAAEQENALVRAAGRGQIALDRERLPPDSEPAFLPSLAPRGRCRRPAPVEAARR